MNIGTQHTNPPCSKWLLLLWHKISFLGCPYLVWWKKCCIMLLLMMFLCTLRANRATTCLQAPSKSRLEWLVAQQTGPVAVCSRNKDFVPNNKNAIEIHSISLSFCNISHINARVILVHYYHYNCHLVTGAFLLPWIYLGPKMDE